LIVLTQHHPRRQTHHNQHARGDRKYHSRPALAIVRLEPHEIPVARTAGGQMVQVRLCLRQGHSVRGNGSDNILSRTSNPLGIRELVAKPSTQYS
jgi:hypothetical protein